MISAENADENALGVKESIHFYEGAPSRNPLLQGGFTQMIKLKTWNPPNKNEQTSFSPWKYANRFCGYISADHEWFSDELKFS